MQPSSRTLPTRILPRRSIKLNITPNTCKSNNSTTPTRTMSVFTHPFYSVPRDNGFGNFGSLVRFIDDWDKHFTQSNDHGTQRNGRSSIQQSSFAPKFDVKETETTYELHGELPGVEKRNVNIEFTDPQTLKVSGRVERTHSAGTPPAGFLEGSKDAEMSGAITAGDDAVMVGGEDSHETASNKSLQATVEDENEDGATNATAQPTPATTVAETAKPTEEEKKPQQPGHKYWVYERSVGNFSRSFAFPSRVEHEGVSASLKDGVLTVTVPKAKKHESRRIAIQ
ncbi:30 kDa heat shock protein [Xylariaceae sp. FL0016]|nr:30 kDa heat shock protein [Xylariaceae sp. FL0016]